MKKTLIFTLASMAMLFAGCSENVDETKTQTLPKGNQVTLTVSAVTKTSPQTRVAYGSTDATWETGDKIYLVKSDGTTITLTLSSGAGTSTGSFTSTDPVVAGTYTPYAVSASSLSKGYVSIENGEITLDLSAGGGGTLANALEHDILKGDAVVLTDGQSSAAIENLTTHILSYIRFQFTATAKAVSSIGISSAEGINQTVTIAANGTVTGSNPTTSTISVSASNVGDNTYAGYIAVYASTPTGLVAHAEDADGGKYSRLVSTISANYTAGKVYGKTFTLSDAMMTAAATGTLSDQNWKNLGLSVKWSEFYVGTSTEYAWSTAFDAYCSVPAGWSGWRFPTTAEVQELYYASNKQWIENTGMRFNCNDNYVAMGASGRYRMRDDGQDWSYDQGTTAYFYVDELSGDLRKRAAINSSSLSFGTPNTYCNNKFCFDDYFAMRLVCDY